MYKELTLKRNSYVSRLLFGHHRGVISLVAVGKFYDNMRDSILLSCSLPGVNCVIRAQLPKSPSLRN